VRYRQTDLWIQADRYLREEAERALLETRMQVEGYARAHPEFLSAHAPLPWDPAAPPVAQWMLEAARLCGVGPMAAVAGAVARSVGESLLEECTEVVIENGGDLFIDAKRAITVAIFAGASPLSYRVGVRIGDGQMPAGVGTSSASVGHSWSYGKADAACIVAEEATLADAAATALCNRITDVADLERALGWGLRIAGVRGGVLIKGESMAVQGGLELVSLNGS